MLGGGGGVRGRVRVGEVKFSTRGEWRRVTWVGLSMDGVKRLRGFVRALLMVVPNKESINYGRSTHRINMYWMKITKVKQLVQGSSTHLVY